MKQIFLNTFLIVDDYSKIQKLYGMDKITNKEVMAKLDMLQYIFRKMDGFG